MKYQSQDKTPVELPLAGDETETNQQKETIKMSVSNTTENLTNYEKAIAEASGPLEPGDARLEELDTLLIAEGSAPFNGVYEGWAPERLGELYGLCSTPSPEYKGPVPAWAVSTDTDSMERNGNPLAHHESRVIKAPGFRSVVTRSDVYDVDSGTTKVGDIELAVLFGSNDVITFQNAWAARTAASALLKAADELDFIQGAALTHEGE